jgi:hypothetical protein
MANAPLGPTAPLEGAPALANPLPPFPPHFVATAAQPAALRFRSACTESEWKEVPTGLGDDGVRQTARKHLSDLLLSENLVVVTGLGTSLCLRDTQGHRLAPLMSDLWNRGNVIVGGRIEQLAAAVKYVPAEQGGSKQWNIEELLSHCHLAHRYAPDPNVAAFVERMESDIAGLCRFTNRARDFNSHEDFLRRVARRSARKPRMKLFTTNYDKAFEAAAARSRFVVIDGFSHSIPQEFDGSFFGYDIVRRENSEGSPNYIEGVFHLYKLHGSVDWERHGSVIQKNEGATNRVMIYPRDSKFASSYEQPHLEMMSRFMDALRQPNTGLLVVGFGFADRHLTGPIIAALRSNVSLKAMVVTPDLETRTQDANAKDEFRQLRLLSDAGDPRLGLLNGTFESLVTLIPDLVADTEEQQLLRRLRAAR